MATHMNQPANRRASLNGGFPKDAHGEISSPVAWPRMLYTIYLPLNYNDGAAIPASLLNRAKDEIARYTGGCTVLPASDGLWGSPDGQTHHARVVPVMVIAQADEYTDRFFRRLAGQLAEVLAQQEVFIHRAPVSVAIASNP